MQAFSRMLTYFIEVARQGSVRKAAEQLNVSASAIDRQILAAEEGLGTPLFDRFPSGMRLTAAGELVLRGALDWGKDLSLIKRQITDLSGLRRGHVRIATIEALARGFLPRIMAHVHKTYPGITLEAVIIPNEAIGDHVATGDFDLGFCLNPQSSKDISIRAFRETSLGAILPSQHRFCTRSSLRFAELLEEPFIRPIEPLQADDQFTALEVSCGLKVNALISTNNIAMIKSLISLGAGVSVLIELDVAAEVAEGSLHFVPLSDAFLRPVTIAICHPRQGRPSHAATLFMDMIEGEKVWGA